MNEAYRTARVVVLSITGREDLVCEEAHVVEVVSAITEAVNVERAACAEVARTTTAYRRPTVEPASGPRRSSPGSILAETIAQAIEARADAAEQEGR